MTIPYPLDAFDNTHALKPKRPRRTVDRSKLLSAGLTLAFHAAVIGGMLTMVHVTPARVAKVLTVNITTDKPQQKTEIAPPPTLVQPTMVSVAMPVIPPTAPRPVIAATPSANPPAPPPPAPAATVQAGQARQDYVAALLAQLNRFKQYPPAARKARIQGVVLLHFVMNAQGHVLTADIARSSGRPILDREALALIRRAQPLPPLPADYPTPTLDAVVPVEFSLNG